MKSLALAFLALHSGSGPANDSRVVESALTADARRQSRLADGEAVVGQLVKSGAFAEKPTLRRDYSDYYAPKKTVRVLDARLILFEYEYQLTYIGCCVNPGNAVVLLPDAGTERIASFARENACDFRVAGQIPFLPDEATKGLTDAERQSLVEVSCKDDRLLSGEVK